MKVLHVVGARPNFMKIAPVMQAMGKDPGHFEQILVHTGQHYDANMSQVFFEELGLPRPDVNLGVGSGSHAWQTARVMLAFEPVLLQVSPEWVVVVGDVNSTLACALVSSKLGIPVCHVEAGLRSYDRTMPEEINRLLTDQISELLFIHSRSAGENLALEGVSPDKVHFVGNVMIDTLVRLAPAAEGRWPRLRSHLGLDEYILVTLHRPANVDNPEVLREILAALDEISMRTPVIFPAHPRTMSEITRTGWEPTHPGFRLIEPLGYLDFLSLQSHASLVLTDSGGIQEETTYLKVPCLTVRPNTERPITLTVGTNELVRPQRGALLAALHRRLNEPGNIHTVPELWDGQAAERIAAVFRSSG